MKNAEIKIALLLDTGSKLDTHVEKLGLAKWFLRMLSNFVGAAILSGLDFSLVILLT